jgi:glutaredoxin
MTAKRKIEIFTAGCPVCDETVKQIKEATCPYCEISVLDLKDPEVAERAKSLGIRSVPAVVINGNLADCCSGRGVDIEKLKDAGLGKPL